MNEFGELLESSVNGQVDLHLSLRRGLPHVVVDPDQLEMALLNIVNNARDAMPDGGLVTISTAPHRIEGSSEHGDVAPGEYVALEVRNEGQGMPPEVVERATEPFFTTKGVGKGTGLGLAMASGFVRQSGGCLEIDSTPGIGTTIRMLFPAAAVNQRPLGPDLHTPAMAVPESDHAQHILVVEDHEEVLVIAREILESAGYKITTAISGEEALKLFEVTHEESRVDLVFTDLVMPGGMNGLALADAVVARDPSVSVLMTTGYNEELVVGGPRRRATDVLSKPYRRTELLDRVRQALNRRGESAPRRLQSDYGAAQA